MICLDSTFLGLLLHPTAKPPDDPVTGQPIERLEDRLDYLEERWADDNEKIIIPTPVLSEFLVLAGQDDGAKYLDDIHASSHFVIVPFDEKSAVELAAICITERAATSNRVIKRTEDGETKAKMKFDRQIVAIAIANGATAIYSDDKGVATFAERNGLQVIQSWTLPLPSAVKVPLPFNEAEDETHEGKTAKVITGEFSGSVGESVEDKARAATSEIEAEDEPIAANSDDG